MARFTVETDDGKPAELGPIWKEQLRDRLSAYAFREPPRSAGKEEVTGWCSAWDLLDSDFTDINKWSFSQYVVLAMRTSVKRLPMRDLKATVQKRCADWASERGVERCPSSVKKEIRELLETEWLARTIPSSSTVEVLWDTESGVVSVGTSSAKALDKVRSYFRRTTGFSLVPESPLTWAPDHADALLTSSPISLEAA